MFFSKDVTHVVIESLNNLPIEVKEIIYDITSGILEIILIVLIVWFFRHLYKKIDEIERAEKEKEIKKSESDKCVNDGIKKMEKIKKGRLNEKRKE